MTTLAAPTLSHALPELLARPNAEERILAGFLTSEDLKVLCPAFRLWPAGSRDRVARRLGAAASLAARPEAGRGQLTSIYEPEALPYATTLGQMLPSSPSAPVSIEWVEIRDLIAVRATTGPIAEVLPVPGDLRARARYSIYGSPLEIMLRNQSWIVGSAPMTISLTGASLGARETEEAVTITCQYRLQPLPTPIVVGLESGKLFLLNEYGRVIQALRSGLTRLVCLVYYGLNLDQPDLGLRLAGLDDPPVNHFGRERVIAPTAPLVRDFADPKLSAAVPARDRLFAFAIQPQGSELTATPPISIPFPLGRTSATSPQEEPDDHQT